MDDLRHLGTFLLIFAAMLMGYGTVLARTGHGCQHHTVLQLQAANVDALESFMTVGPPPWPRRVPRQR